MLKKKKQEKYFNRHWEGMFSHLYNYCVGQNPDELHKLRVEIKKIEALFMFAKTSSWKEKDKKRFKKYFQPVRKVFKNAGKIRTAYVNIQLIDKYKEENSGFRDKQNEILLKESNKFCAHMISFAEVINKNHDKLLKLFYDIDKKEIPGFYKKQLRQLNNFFSNYKNSGELHECRKKIKNLLYIYSILTKPLAKKINLNTKYFDGVQDAIGKWHDADVAIEVLSSAGFAEEPVIDELKAHREDYLKTITSSVENFLSKAIL